MSFFPQLPSAVATRQRRERLSPALRAYQYNLLAYKRTWRGSVTTTFLYPVLYLAAIGVGLGHLIDHGSNQAVGGVRYLWFLAPGLLAGTAMQIATNESTFPVMAEMCIRDRVCSSIVSSRSLRAASGSTIPGSRRSDTATLIEASGVRRSWATELTSAARHSSTSWSRFARNAWSRSWARSIARAAWLA